MFFFFSRVHHVLSIAPPIYVTCAGDLYSSRYPRPCTYLYPLQWDGRYTPIVNVYSQLFLAFRVSLARRAN